MTQLHELATRLTLGADGIWQSSEEKKLSYPAEGNADYFQLEDGSFWFQHRNQVLCSIVQRFPPQGAVFDVGGGNGCVAKALEDAGHETVLIEPGPTGALNAKRRGLSHVICSTVEAAGFPPSSLPAVGLFDVVEHIENDLAFLQGIRSLLKPQGLVYITVPAFSNLWSQEDVHAGHYRRYTRRSLEETLNNAGLKLLYSTYFFSFLTLPVFLMRSVPSRLGFRKQSKMEVTRKEHQEPSGLGNWWLKRARSNEIQRIKSGGSLRWGSSCLAVAQCP
jgi:SAM-dependent methyltransferase